EFEKFLSCDIQYTSSTISLLFRCISHGIKSVCKHLFQAFNDQTSIDRSVLQLHTEFFCKSIQFLSKTKLDSYISEECQPFEQLVSIFKLFSNEDMKIIYYDIIPHILLLDDSYMDILMEPMVSTSVSLYTLTSALLDYTQDNIGIIGDQYPCSLLRLFNLVFSAISKRYQAVDVIPNHQTERIYEKSVLAMRRCRYPENYVILMQSHFRTVCHHYAEHRRQCLKLKQLFISLCKFLYHPVLPALKESISELALDIFLILSEINDTGKYFLEPMHICLKSANEAIVKKGIDAFQHCASVCDYQILLSHLEKTKPEIIHAIMKAANMIDSQTCTVIFHILAKLGSKGRSILIDCNILEDVVNENSKKIQSMFLCIPMILDEQNNIKNVFIQLEKVVLDCRQIIFSPFSDPHVIFLAFNFCRLLLRKLHDNFSIEKITKFADIRRLLVVSLIITGYRNIPNEQHTYISVYREALIQQIINDIGQTEGFLNDIAFDILKELLSDSYIFATNGGLLLATEFLNVRNENALHICMYKTFRTALDLMTSDKRYVIENGINLLKLMSARDLFKRMMFNDLSIVLNSILLSSIPLANQHLNCNLPNFAFDTFSEILKTTLSSYIFAEICCIYDMLIDDLIEALFINNALVAKRVDDILEFFRCKDVLIRINKTQLCAIVQDCIDRKSNSYMQGLVILDKYISISNLLSTELKDKIMSQLRLLISDLNKTLSTRSLCVELVAILYHDDALQLYEPIVFGSNYELRKVIRKSLSKPKCSSFKVCLSSAFYESVTNLLESNLDDLFITLEESDQLYTICLMIPECITQEYLDKLLDLIFKLLGNLSTDKQNTENSIISNLIGIFAIPKMSINHRSFLNIFRMQAYPIKIMDKILDVITRMPTETVLKFLINQPCLELFKKYTTRKSSAAEILLTDKSLLSKASEEVVIPIIHYLSKHVDDFVLSKELSHRILLRWHATESQEKLNKSSIEQNISSSTDNIDVEAAGELGSLYIKLFSNF
ncbi:hypothetical protein GJ496_003334, partial [Pomphorhynchus laevis]